MQPEPVDFADVLVAMGKAANCLPRVEQDLTDVLPLIAGGEPVRKFLSDPAILAEGKRNALLQIVGAHVHPALVSFLCFLADEHQLTRIGEIAGVFFEKVSHLRKEASGEVVSAVPLKKETVALIEEEIGRLLTKKVALRPRVDPGLLGGLYVRVGDFVIDGTLDRQLDGLRQTLLR